MCGVIICYCVMFSRSPKKFVSVSMIFVLVNFFCAWTSVDCSIKEERNRVRPISKYRCVVAKMLVRKESKAEYVIQYLFKANNKYVKENQTKVIRRPLSLIYFDRNNLYGKVMSPKLPVKEFYENYEGNSETGHFFDVEIKYTKKLKF